MAEPSPLPPAGSGPPHAAERRELAAAVVAVAAGGGLALLAAARTWSTVTVLRAAPLGPVAARISGRTLQPAVTGLAVVALAGVLALLATRGVVRRLIGVVLALTGTATIWRAALGLSPVSGAHGRALVASSRTGATLGNVQAVHVSMHPVWALLAVLGGALIVAGGAGTLARGGRWRAMSARYESPVGSATGGPATAGTTAGAEASADVAALGAGDPAGEVARARADLALWLQLDRGEDPTARDDDPAPTADRDPPKSAEPTRARTPPSSP